MRVIQVTLLLLTHVVSSYAQPEKYSISNPMPYTNEFLDDTAWILRIGTQPIDTISSFGIKILDDSTILYHKIELDRIEPTPEVYYGYESNFILYKNGTRTLLNKVLPQFNDWLSAPAIIDGWVYYWSVEERSPAKGTSLYAMRYNFKSGKVDSLFLTILSDEYVIESGIFGPPAVYKSGYRFPCAHGEWIVNRSFTESAQAKSE